jgi:16S rRNA (uracil1498-N3)-methyltransferase
MTEGWAAAQPAAAHVIVDDRLDDGLVVTGDDGHHLQRVRRLRVGEAVTAADGEGHWRSYRIDEVGEGRLVLAATGEPRVEPASVPPLAVAFSLTKGEKPETVVARLTELGVDRVLPVLANRSVARWSGDRAATALTRLRRVAREAAQQSRRARLPLIEPLGPLAGLVGTPGLVVGDRGAPAAGALGAPGPEGWLAVVGPEGGFDPEERAAFEGAPRVGVGPHVLRAETAAVAVAAALASLRH